MAILGSHITADNNLTHRRGGGVERDHISDIRPPKNQISDLPPPKSNIRYHLFTKNQISDMKRQKISYQIAHPLNKSNIRYQGTAVPPHILSTILAYSVPESTPPCLRLSFILIIRVNPYLVLTYASTLVFRVLSILQVFPLILAF